MDLHLHFWYCLFTFSESGAKRIHLLHERLGAKLEATSLLADDIELQLGLSSLNNKSAHESKFTSKFSFLIFSISVRIDSINWVSRAISALADSSSKRMDVVPLSDWFLISNSSDLYFSDCSRMVRLSSRAASSCWRRSSYCFCRAL